jgi:hypothetical protein
MKKHIFNFTTILLFLAGSFFSCNKEKELLTDNTWKLVGFVDAVSGEMKEAKPSEEYCYILKFHKNRKLTGATSTNRILEAKYKINYSTYKINISIEIMTMANECYDGYLYIESLDKVDSFSLQEDKLRLYYNDKQNYLLFIGKRL